MVLHTNEKKIWQNHCDKIDIAWYENACVVLHGSLHTSNYHLNHEIMFLSFSSVTHTWAIPLSAKLRRKNDSKQMHFQLQSTHLMVCLRPRLLAVSSSTNLFHKKRQTECVGSFFILLFRFVFDFQRTQYQGTMDAHKNSCTPIRHCMDGSKRSYHS